MKTYHLFMDGAKVSDYIKGEIDGIIKTEIIDAGIQYPWFNPNDGTYWSKRLEVTPEKLGIILRVIETICPGVIKRVEIE